MVCPYNKTSYPASRRAPTRSSSYLGGESGLTSFFILILLLGTVVAAACNNDDRASTVAETPPPAAPTPDVEAIVETAVREMLEAIPTLTPLPTPDIEAIVETVLLRATDTLLETLVMGLSRNYPYQAAWVQATHHPRREPS